MTVRDDGVAGFPKMQETYYHLGRAASPMGVISSLATFLAMAALLGLIRRRVETPTTLFLVLCWGALSLWTLPPQNIHIPMFFLLVGFGFAADMKRLGRLKRSEAWLAAVGFPIAAIIFSIVLVNMGREDVVIDGRLLTQKSTFRGDVTVERGQFRLSATKSRDESMWRSSGWSWSTYTEGDIGPGIISNDIYWHGSGFIRGEQLGKRIAEWAGVEPKYSIIEEN